MSKGRSLKNRLMSRKKWLTTQKYLKISWENGLISLKGHLVISREQKTEGQESLDVNVSQTQVLECMDLSKKWAFIIMFHRLLFCHVAWRFLPNKFFKFKVFLKEKTAESSVCCMRFRKLFEKEHSWSKHCQPYVICTARRGMLNILHYSRAFLKIVRTHISFELWHVAVRG